MKIIFMGTPDFAVPTLEKLLVNNYEIIAVFTQPDRERGRGLKVSCCPVKSYILEKNIPCYQPENINQEEYYSIISNLNPDLIITVAFGQILKKKILDIPKYGCINLHSSLLPKYRGAAPINWAIINGEKVSGVTTFFLDKGMDTGDIIFMKEVPIDDDMNAGTYHDILAIEGAELVLKTIKAIEKGEVVRIPQNNEMATYAPKITKEDCRINWEKSAIEIHNLIRGLNPHPGCFTFINDLQINIIKSAVVDKEDFAKAVPGEIVEINKNEIIVAAKSGYLKILEVKPATKKNMAIKDFLNGYKLHKGEKFANCSTK